MKNNIIPDSEYYYLNGQHHRENAPAVIYIKGYQAWFIHNKRHKLDGPAEKYNDGRENYYINGKKNVLNVTKYLIIYMI